MQADLPIYNPIEIVQPDIPLPTVPAYTITETVLPLLEIENTPEVTEEVSKPTQKVKKDTKEKTVSTSAQSAVDLARTFLGQPYVWGGKSPKTGFDCSGLIGYVYKLAGINIPFSTYGLFTTGKKVSLQDAKVGDIICTPGTGLSGRHVKMISKIDSNGLIYTIEAKGKKWGIVESPLNNVNNIISIRRVAES